jgi:predicted ester cyclase
MSDGHLKNKPVVWEFWQALQTVDENTVGNVLQQYLDNAVHWHTSHPINTLHGTNNVLRQFWQPVLQAFTQLKRQTDIFFGAGDWVCGGGYFAGQFVQDWLGIPATHQPTRIRFGEFCRVHADKIIENYMLLDVVDVMRQAGFRVLPTSNGLEHRVPAPATNDGVMKIPQDEAQAQRSLKLVNDMLAGLGRYDGTDLGSMDMPTYWRDDMHWYGPCGIGTATSLANYYQVHSRPFLTAFPNRVPGESVADFAEGNYVGFVGWPSVLATHTGPYLGCAPSGAAVGMNLMDFWRRDGDKLAENWVLIDLPHLFLQMGVDLFGRLHQQISARSK